MSAQRVPPTTRVSDVPRTRRGGGFVAATVSFVTVFAAGATAFPLYDTYRSADGVTDAEFSIVAVVYFACAVFALLVLGRLSDHLGRRPVSIAALLVAAVGCVTLTWVHDVVPLMIGRGLQGLAAGLASSALAAYAVDTAPQNPRWLVSTVTSAAATVGLAVGVFVSGALVEFAPAPRVLTFLVFGGVLVACAVAVATRPETVERHRGAVRSLVPQLRVPPRALRFLPVAASIFIATWALGGYFQSFGPSVAADYLGSDSPLMAAAVFASYMAPGFLGGPLAGRLGPAAGQRVGMLLVAVAASGLVTALTVGSASLFVIAGVLGGIGMGTGMSGSMSVLLPAAAPSQRAGLLAVIYGLSYAGAAVPGLVAGQLTHVLSLLTITVGYGALASIACVFTLIAARDPR